MPVVVGVDAGGTSTRALAERDGIEGALVVESGANVRFVGVEGATSTIGRAVERALNGTKLDAMHVGMAGGGAEATREALRTGLQQRFPGAKVDISDDAHIVLRAGAPEGNAVALMSGTGSIVCADIDGTYFRCGGYGYLIGDEGSAYAMGKAAINLTLRVYDGRVAMESLFERIEEHLGAHGTQAILDAVYLAAEPIQVTAALAPLVLRAAADGERSATKIVQGAALDLFDLVKSIVRLAQIGDREIPLVLSGGSFAQNSLLTYLLETRIASEYPHLVVTKDAPRPIYGAIALARQLATAT